MNRSLQCLIMGSIFIGFSPILVRLSDLEPTISAFYRVSLVFPFFLIPILMLNKNKRQKKSEISKVKELSLLFLAGCFFGADIAIFHSSIDYTTIANATLLVNFAPIFVAIGAWIFLAEKISIQFIIALLTAMTGAAVLIGPSHDGFNHSLIGDLMSLTAALFYGGYILVVKYLRQYISSTKIMLYSTGFCTLFLIPVNLFMLDGFQPWLPQSLSSFMSVLGLALICHGLGQGLISYALLNLPASFSSLTLLIQPVIAAVSAWFIFQEYMSAIELLGAIMVLFGIMIAKENKITRMISRKMVFFKEKRI